MISEGKERLLIFSGDLVCSLQLGVSKESRVTLTSVYTPREQGIIPMGSVRWWFCSGRKGKKVNFFGCMFAVFFPKRERKATDVVLLGLLHTPHISKLKFILAKLNLWKRWRIGGERRNSPLWFPRGILVEMTLFKEKKATPPKEKTHSSLNE